VTVGALNWLFWACLTHPIAHTDLFLQFSFYCVCVSGVCVFKFVLCVCVLVVVIVCLFLNVCIDVCVWV